MGIETTWPGRNIVIPSPFEWLRLRHQEKVDHRETIWRNYTTTRDMVHKALTTEVDTLFAKAFAVDAPHSQALTEITTHALVLDVLQETLREAKRNPQATTIFGEAAARSEQHMIARGLEEKAIRIMENNSLIGSADAVTTVRNGVNILTPQKELKETMPAAVMETACTYLLQGGHTEIERPLQALLREMTDTTHGQIDHRNRVQERMQELEKIVKAVLEPAVLSNNDHFDSVRTNIIGRVSQKTALRIGLDGLTSRADKRALQKMFDEREEGFDAFSRLSRGVAAASSVLFVLLPLLHACKGGIPPGSDTPSVPTGKPTDDHDQTPSATPTPISPELTRTPPAIIGNLPDVTALSGIAPGVGGTGELVTNPFDGSIQAAINTVRFGVVHAGSTVSVESAHNGTNLCFSAIPASIYDPDHVSDPKGDLLLRQENGVAKYGFNQALAEVLVPRDTDTATYSCVLGYALQGNQDFKAGTLRMLLVRTNKSGSVDVIGSMQAGFSSSEDVQVRDGVVFVNGEKQDWTLFPNMVLTTLTETPVPTEMAPNFYHGLAPTLEQFTLVDRADIPDIIDYLASQPSLLPPASKAIELSTIGPPSRSGESHFSILCNYRGEINCVPAASIQIAEQGIDPHIIIFELRNKDGSRGYIPLYMYDSYQYYYIFGYQRLVANPFGSYDKMIQTGLTADAMTRYAYTVFLFQQPGYLEAVQQWIDTGNVPEALKYMIVPW